MYKEKRKELHKRKTYSWLDPWPCIAPVLELLRRQAVSPRLLPLAAWKPAGWDLTDALYSTATARVANRKAKIRRRKC